MTHVNELDAEIEAVLRDLVESGLLELATKRGAKDLARPLSFALERDLDLDLEQWLVDHEEVSELFVDRDQLHGHFSGVRARMAGARPPQHINRKLADAIAINLEDRSAWAVYGDWLVEQGDPRGELVALQLAGKDGQLMIARYRDHFLGELELDPDDERERPELTWRNGFLQSANIVDADLEVLLSLESARFLETLVVRACKDISIMSYLYELPVTLRSLTFELSSSTHVEDADLDEVLAAVPNLTSLSVVAGRVLLPTSSTLESLSIHTFGLVGPIGAFTTLERLALFCTREENDVIVSLCANPLPRLRELDLRGCDLTPEEERRIRAYWPFAQLGPHEDDDRYAPIDE
jgi:uncharacterized protein (TIGR02996 family)